MKLQVRTINGNLHELNISPTDSVETLKNNLNEFVNIPSEQQKLIYRGRNLSNSLVIGENVKEGDTLVVLKSRKIPPVPIPDLTPIPTKSIIYEYTARGKPIPRRRQPMFPSSPSTLTNLRNQFQDLVGSFVGLSSATAPAPASTTTTTATPTSTTAQPSSSEEANATSSSTPVPTPSSESPAAAQLPPINPSILQQLKDMGFSEERSKKALYVNSMNPSRAMEWLLEHEEDADIDDPLTPQQVARVAARVDTFTPDVNAIQKLKDMGFPEEEIVQALRATNNNADAACAWLLGEREETITLDESSFGLLSSVLNNPTIQAGLANPRVLHALRSLLEDPANASQYLNDPEIGPVLLQVHNLIQNH